MKRNAITIPLLILFTIIILILVLILISSNTSLSEEREAIINIINKEYYSYEIKDIQLEYIDFYSTVRSADEYHNATSATAIIENEEEQIILHFKKTFNIWSIKSSYPNYGSNIPNEVYFVNMEYNNIGKAVDIDEYIKGCWVIPDENGNLYTKVGDTTNWYYSFRECKNIYKTKDGYVYVFDKGNSDWERSTVTYADLCYYSNYENVTKEYAIEIIEKFSFYREN